MAKAAETTIVVNGVEYVPKGSMAPKKSNIKIVVLQRGWVMIGRFSQVDDTCVLDDAYVIRSWGTSKGLGELALEGKKASTKLDPCGHVEFHVLTIVAMINCKDELWTAELV